MRYKIKGNVIDESNGEGAAGVRVEAWDKGSLVDDYLGYAPTLSDGSFVIPLDEATFREYFVDLWPDIYFKVWCGDECLASTEDYANWDVKRPDEYVEIRIPCLKPVECCERHIYLKIEGIEDYNPVKPQEEEAGQAVYGRDCMRNVGHENGFIPEAEIEARAVPAVVYREYLDSAYLIPKPDKLILADINEPLYLDRVPGTVIYARPCQRLIIHVWNTDNVPHSLHAHGLSYGIDSDGTWPFGTEAAHHGGRSDAICPGKTWCYTFDVTEKMLGAWPFHDYTHHSNEKIDQGLFGGIVVLGACDKPPASFRFRKGMLAGIYADLERNEGRSFLLDDKKIDFDNDAAPFIFAPQVHAKRFKEETLQILEHHLDFIEEYVAREFSQDCNYIPTDHVPVFFHVMSRRKGGRVVVDPVPFNPDAVLNPNAVLNPAVAFEAAALQPALAAVDRAALAVRPLQPRPIPTLCINGRGFVGNSPTIVGRTGQRIRWYVFNLDVGSNSHNFNPHGMRWRFAGENIDTRSFGPGESFVVEATIPPVILLTEEQERIQEPRYRPKDARLFRLKGDFLFHCYEREHLLNGMAGLVRARQGVWLTPAMAEAISNLTGLPLDNGSNACPDVDPDPCGGPKPVGRWEEVAGIPGVLLMHSILLPNTRRVLFWGQTGRPDQSEVWDYSTPAGAYLPPANQPASLPGMNPNLSDLWSSATTLLDDPQGTVLAHGGFSGPLGGNGAFLFDPPTLTWSDTNDTADNRFYATTLTLNDGRALTLFGSASKSIEIYTRGPGWAPRIPMPAAMNHHEYYPWTYLLPDGRLFICGPHDPSQRFDFNAPAGVESFPTVKGNRSNGGEKGSSVLLILRPPDYKAVGYIMGGNVGGTENTAEQAVLSDPAPVWSLLPNLNQMRSQQFTATLLPDGRVFVAGGLSGGPDGGPCEIFDPRNPGAGWVQGPNMKFDRTYHSSFLLLLDGSVLGGGAPPNIPPPGPYTAHERFFPDYFEKLRPVINNAPASVSYGGNFTINTPTPPDISEVVLLRAGAVTHGFNMSQRGLELVIAGTGPGTLDVQGPPNANLAPPGWYVLFILDSDRVPSEGRWIRVTP